MGDVEALKLALLLIFLQPGAPCIYYGTEAGLSGGPEAEQSSGPEPGCREAFPWDAAWPHDLRDFITALSTLRRNVPVFRQGELRWTSLGVDGLHAVGDGVALWVNRARQATLALPNGLSDALLEIGEVDLEHGLIGGQSAVVVKALDET